jgi:hypothetical protein
MHRTIFMGAAAAAFVVVSSWSMMSKRADATTAAAMDIGSIQRSVDVAKLPVADVAAYEAY